MTLPALTAARYRNRLEEGIGAQLSGAGLSFEYEGSRIPYTVPTRTAHYLPDFRVGNIVIEGKGWFKSARDRQKLLHVRNSHPGLDIRLVFTNAKKKIYKGSKTTYEQWADDHGFEWSDKGIVPAEWIEDLREEMKRCR